MFTVSCYKTRISNRRLYRSPLRLEELEPRINPAGAVAGAGAVIGAGVNTVRLDCCYEELAS